MDDPLALGFVFCTWWTVGTLSLQVFCDRLLFFRRRKKNPTEFLNTFLGRKFYKKENVDA